MENKDQNRPRRKKNIKKNLLIFVILILIAIGSYMIIKQFSKANSKNMTIDEINQNSYNSSKIMRADLNDIKSIEFDLKTTDVRIQRSATNPYIEYTNLYKDDNSYEVNVNFQDGNLQISSNIKGDLLYMKNKIQIVRIFLPKEGSIEKVTGKIGAGEVKISDLEAKDVNLILESGDITFENSYFSGKVKNNSGSINLLNTEINNGTIVTKVGDINAEKIVMRSNLDFEVDNGNITIKTEDPIDSFDITSRLNVGNFVLGNVSYRNIMDGYQTETGSKKKINLKTNIGNISFNKGEGAFIEEEETYTSTSVDDEESSDEASITPVDESILEQNSSGNDKEEENN